MRNLALLICAALILSLTGCNLLSDEKIEEGVVIAPKLKIRSSTAPAALDLAEVKRGDKLEILEHREVKTPTGVVEWYKVRTRGPDQVLGWVEARHVISQQVVKKIEELYQQSIQIPSQGRGRLKVRAKLRIEPGGEIITMLNRGTMVDIVGKARTTFKPEEEGADESSEKPEVRTVLWYQIRLPDTEVLRAGWVGAQQVELDVPEEILHLEGEGRRFTGWVVLDQTRDRDGQLKNNYIGLMKSFSAEGQIDFTRLWILTYSPEEKRYVSPYIEDGLRGVLPVTLGTSSGKSGFTIRELDENGNTVPVEYEAVRIGPSKLRVKRLTPKIYLRKKRSGPSKRP